MDRYWGRTSLRLRNDDDRDHRAPVVRGQYLWARRLGFWRLTCAKQRQPSDGFGSNWRLFAARVKNPLRTDHLYQRFVRTKSPLYLSSRPTWLVWVAHFPFAPRLIERPSLFAFLRIDLGGTLK
jgi:hypothetical protein